MTSHRQSALQLHSTSSQILGLVKVSCVWSLWLWVMWVSLWHSRLKSLPQDPKKGVDTQRGVRDSPETAIQKVQSTLPAESRCTSEDFWQFVKVQSCWPIQ